VYGPRFVAGILAGFEDALEILKEGVDAEIRTELEELAECVENTRMRIDPSQARSETDETERGVGLG
jgi:hypothetical protein